LGRRWAFLENDNLIDDLKKWLQILVAQEQRNITLIPSGEVVKWLCEISKDAGSSILESFDEFKLDVSFEIYQSFIDDISRFNIKTEKKIREKGETLSHLDHLESESIHIMREALAGAENPVMLYSWVGKDSAVMLHLAIKAFYPSKLPFLLLHVDTTWKFQAMYDFRSWIEK